MFFGKMTGKGTPQAELTVCFSVHGERLDAITNAAKYIRRDRQIKSENEYAAFVMALAIMYAQDICRENREKERNAV